jgi:hypothetical protein
VSYESKEVAAHALFVFLGSACSAQLPAVSSGEGHQMSLDFWQ